MAWFLDRWRVRKHWKLRVAMIVVALVLLFWGPERWAVPASLVLIALSLFPYWRSDLRAQTEQRARMRSGDPH